MTEEMVRYYAQQAAEYDQQYENSRIQNDLRAITNMVLHVFRGKRVYEVACGTGRWTQHIAQVALDVLAIDVNESMLEIACKRKYPDNVVTFARADAYAFNTSPRKFNGGVIGFWISHVDLARMDKFLKAFHSWLESGAIVLIFDDIQTSDRLTTANRIDEHGNRYEKRTLRNGEKFEIIENFFSEEYLLNLIDSYGIDPRYETLENKWMLRYRVR